MLPHTNRHVIELADKDAAHDHNYDQNWLRLLTAHPSCCVQHIQPGADELHIIAFAAGLPTTVELITAHIIQGYQGG